MEDNQENVLSLALRDLLFGPDSPLYHIRDRIYGYLSFPDLLSIEQHSRQAAACVKAFPNQDRIFKHTTRCGQLWWSEDVFGRKNPLIMSTDHDISYLGPVIRDLTVYLEVDEELKLEDKAKDKLYLNLLQTVASHLLSLNLDISLPEYFFVPLSPHDFHGLPAGFTSCTHLTLSLPRQLSLDSRLLASFPALREVTFKYRSPSLSCLPNPHLLRSLTFSQCRDEAKHSPRTVCDAIDLSGLETLFVAGEYETPYWGGINWTSPLVKFSKFKKFRTGYYSRTDTERDIKHTVALIVSLSRKCPETFTDLHLETPFSTYASDEYGRYFADTLRSELKTSRGDTGWLLLKKITFAQADKVCMQALLKAVKSGHLESLICRMHSARATMEDFFDLPDWTIHSLKHLTFIDSISVQQEGWHEIRNMESITSVTRRTPHLKSLRIRPTNGYDLSSPTSPPPPPPCLAAVTPTLADTLCELTLLDPIWDTSLLLPFLRGLKALKILELYIEPNEHLDRPFHVFSLYDYVLVLCLERAAFDLHSLATVIMNVEDQDRNISHFKPSQALDHYQDLPMKWIINGDYRMTFTFNSLP